MAEPEQRSIVARRALERGAGSEPPDPVAEAEARLRSVLEEVTALDGEVEGLSGALAEFARRYELTLGGQFAALGEAERLVRRLQRLEDEVARLAVRLRAVPEEPEAEVKRRARAGSRRRRRKVASPGAAPFCWHGFEPDPAEAADPGDRKSVV